MLHSEKLVGTAELPGAVQLLLQRGSLTEEQIQEALGARKGDDQSLEKVLISLGHIGTEDLLRAVSEQSGVEYVESPRAVANPAVAGLISEDVLAEHMAAPLRLEGGRLIVAMVNPDDLYARSDLTISSGYPISPVVSSEEAILDLLRNGYSADGSSAHVDSALEPSARKAKPVLRKDPLLASPKLGNLLLGMGKITEEQLEEANAARKQGDQREVGEIVFSLGYVSKQDLGQALAKRLRTEFVVISELTQHEVEAEALNLVGEEKLRKYMALPLRFENGRLVVAMSDPNNLQAQEDLRFIARQPIVAVVAAQEDLEGAFTQLFGAAEDEIDEEDSSANGAAEAPRGDRGGFRSFKIGAILVEMNKVSEEKINEGLVLQEQGDPRKMGDILISLGYVSRADVAQAIASKLRLDYVDLSENDVDRSVTGLVQQKVLRRHGAMPLRLEDGRLVVAMSDPSNIHALEDLMMISGHPITPVVALDDNIQAIFNTVFAVGQGISEILQEAARDSETDPTDEIDLGIEGTPDEAPVIRLVSSILQQAVGESASDIHIEPRAKEITVRLRVDGVLRETMSIPTKLQNSVIARLKILGNLDIAEKRVPQDGRFSVKLGSQKIDFRVAALPTVFGEKLVLRLIDSASAGVDLRKLGFEPQMLDRYREIFKRPYGAILVTGPTGSGKSTTLYSTLSELNSPEKNIITVEDPVESRVPGVNQVQVNPKAGLTFASGLRSILRADPDIVMIGEIRDFETAKISVEAALTGHLVLATLHTNNAPGALGRLTDMGVEPFLTSSAVDCVIAQRLGRRLCEHCKERVEIEEEVLSNLQFPFELMDKAKHDFYKAVGCKRCGNSGYKGRVGLYELMVVNQEIREMMLKHASTGDIARVAEETGMIPLREDGLVKAAQGLTTIEEVLRTVV